MSGSIGVEGCDSRHEYTKNSPVVLGAGSFAAFVRIRRTERTGGKGKKDYGDDQSIRNPPRHSYSDKAKPIPAERIESTPPNQAQSVVAGGTKVCDELLPSALPAQDPSKTAWGK